MWQHHLCSKLVKRVNYKCYIAVPKTLTKEIVLPNRQTTNLTYLYKHVVGDRIALWHDEEHTTRVESFIYKTQGKYYTYDPVSGLLMRFSDYLPERIDVIDLTERTIQKTPLRALNERVRQHIAIYGPTPAFEWLYPEQRLDWYKCIAILNSKTSEAVQVLPDGVSMKLDKKEWRYIALPAGEYTRGSALREAERLYKEAKNGCDLEPEFLKHLIPEETKL